ncbi:MAG: methylmalonyl-CoA epimerase [Acidobacteriaceae bacterium]|jgi:methylmalonyl-CoA epimerase|nr:methylmalonyl-CoA epimerase [Acidobacteriaceae bacterium]
MKAVIDHIGIAVGDLGAALAFYRDVLGLRIELSEEVVSQRVRAHFIPAGAASLELLEATTSDSVIARYVEKRGPGLHHVALRVDDIDAALAHLKARGVRLIDEHPRPGAEHSRVAFVHPSSTHGVLVELKQPIRPPETEPPPARVQRFTCGNFELMSLYDGVMKLDGGAMFGVVPKTLWTRQTPADDRNRITMAMRPLLIKGEQTLLIDAGLGDKEDERFHEIYGIDRAAHLDHALAEAGVAVDEIDLVIATHLHFDHAGGFTTRGADGRVRPRFPRARYIINRGEWQDATHPHVRNRASYLADNFVPLVDAGVVDFVDTDTEVVPGVWMQRTGGHTAWHQMVWIESAGQRAAYVADLIPTVAHLPDAWIMGYDLYPMDTLTAKQAFVREALARETLVFFEHDPAVAAGYLLESNGKRSLQHPS